MPAISKIRLTNVVYEQGQKRYHDEIFLFDGHNGAVLLENGGGKTVFIQTVLQAIIPHTDIAERKVKDTLNLDEGAAHIAIEWLLNEKPRRYVVTAVTIYRKLNGIESLRYVYEYGENDAHSIDLIPFIQPEGDGKRPSSRGEMSDYYSYMTSQYTAKAKTFSQSIKSFREFIENQYQIIGNEWESIVQINGSEGGIEEFFENCKKTNELIDRLLIPSVEKGIAGYKKDTFADMFENHREQFKKYKELKEKVQENKLLQQELAIYVEQFKKVDDKEITYLNARKSAKGYYQLLLEDLHKVDQQLLQLEQSFLEWQTEQQRLEQKRTSLHIHKENETLNNLQKEQNDIQKLVDQLEFKRNNSQQEYYSLKLAQINIELKNELENLQFVEKELETLDQDETVEQLHLKLDDINGQLHYLFLELKEKFEKQIKNTTLSKKQNEEQRDKIQEKINTISSEIQNIRSKQVQAKTKVEEKSNQMKSIKLQLVSHEEESIEELLSKWINEQNRLDEEKITLHQQIKQLNIERQEKEQQVKSKNSEIHQKQLEQTKKIERKLQFDQAHERIIKQLAETLYQWSFLQSVYEKKSSIEQQIEERLAILQGKKEEFLIKERIAKRYVDDYANQENFFADPYIEKQIQQWNQFSYLKTGISYIQSVEIDASNIDYPFWATSLITTEHEKEALIEKLQSVQHHLTYPIFVLTVHDAARYAKGEPSLNEVVEPTIWRNNFNEQIFNEWKATISQNAEEKTMERVEIEKTIQLWEQTKQSFHQFINEFPIEQYNELNFEITGLSHELENLQLENQKLDDRIHEIKRDLDIKEQQLSGVKERFQNLQEKRIPLANDFIRLKKEVQQQESQIVLYENHLKEQERIEGQLKVQLQEVLDDILKDRDDLSSLKYQLKFEVEINEIYEAVKSTRPINSTANMNTLKELRTNTLDQLKQVQKTRGEWEARRESSKKRINDLEGTKKNLLMEFDNFDEKLVFPVNGKEKIYSLQRTIRELERDLNEEKGRLQNKHTECAVQESKIKQLIQQYESTFSSEELISFEEDINTVEAILDAEQTQLTKRHLYLQQQQQNAEQVERNCKKAQLIFEKNEKLHKLNDPHLNAGQLTDEEIQAFSYSRIPIIEKVIRGLDDNKQQVDNEYNYLGKAKEQFKKFCHELTDPKMRKIALDGIDTKSTYSEVLNHHQLLEEQIDRTNQFAETSIRGYDEEQQRVMMYIHLHLRKVREDLLEIPRRTRVKVGDEWRTIYKVEVPDWDEDEGKERIREYINWILSKIEQRQYMDENGIEDPIKIRQFLEKSLQTVPLLREVIGNLTIKVKCLKVESDNHISKNYYSWEQSNQWSGGEKWSKNMALFLGILNFIAEKSQHIQSNAKRHRTVILDNPFGKASSDHVLSPVFFIAEQLGFQVIALTAHAEGKFLADYFPIIYSCRLRHLAGSSKQVMTKEKQIQTAFFQDHAPESLERLGEREQMSLF